MTRKYERRIKDYQPTTKKSERNRAIQEMRDDGYPMNAIAEAFNISRQRVGQLLGVTGETKTNRPRKAKKKQITAEQKFLWLISVGNDCWEWLGRKDPCGYGIIYHKSKRGNTFAHRLSFELFNYKIPKGMFVCHTCDNPSCVNPNHLYVGTPKDNIRDREKRKRGNRSKRLSKSQVLNIRKDYDSGDMNLVEISRKYNIRYITTLKVAKRESYKGVL